MDGIRREKAKLVVGKRYGKRNEKGDHLSGVHGYAGDIRMQLNNLSRPERAKADLFLDKIGNAPLEAKKEALKLMIEYGQPILDDRVRDLGYDFKSRKQLANEYVADMKSQRAEAYADASVDKLRRQIESKDHRSKSGKALKGQKLSEARIDDLLAMVRDEPVNYVEKDKRFAGQAIQAYNQLLSGN